MSEMATKFAGRFLNMHSAVIHAVQECPDPRWSDLCEEEGETIGAVANHIAAGYRLELELISNSLSGLPPPEIYMMDGALDRYHAQASLEYSHFTKSETLAHLQENGMAVYRFLSELEETDLAQPVTAPMILKWFGQPLTLEMAIEFLIHGHPTGHLDSIRKALEARTSASLSSKPDIGGEL